MTPCAQSVMPRDLLSVSFVARYTLKLLTTNVRSRPLAAISWKNLQASPFFSSFRTAGSCRSYSYRALPSALSIWKCVVYSTGHVRQYVNVMGIHNTRTTD